MSHDDESIESEDLVYRRVPRKPRFVAVYDRGRNVYVPAFGALRLDDDGMSGLLDSIVQEIPVVPRELFDNVAFMTARYSVLSVRNAGGGVTRTPNSGEHGAAHVSVFPHPNHPDGPKDAWDDVRDEIQKYSEWVVEPNLQDKADADAEYERLQAKMLKRRTA